MLKHFLLLLVSGRYRREIAAVREAERRLGEITNEVTWGLQPLLLGEWRDSHEQCRRRLLEIENALQKLRFDEVVRTRRALWSRADMQLGRVRRLLDQLSRREGKQSEHTFAKASMDSSPFSSRTAPHASSEDLARPVKGDLFDQAGLFGDLSATDRCQDASSSYHPFSDHGGTSSFSFDGGSSGCSDSGGTVSGD